MMLLLPPWQMDVGEKALAAFSLKLANEPCQTVTDRLYEDKPYNLCKVVRSVNQN
jgi:hypothetical protein